MDISIITLSVLSGAASGSGVVAASFYLLKDRWMERVKAGYAKDLEVFRDSLLSDQKRIQARIDRSIFVSRAQFDTEFNAMKDIFRYATETRLAMEQIRPTFGISHASQDDNSKRIELFEKIGTMVNAFNIFSTQLESLSPFYPHDLYRSLTECRAAAALEITQVRTGGDQTFGINWFIQGSKNTDAFGVAYHRASVIIRERLDRLSIVSH